MGTFKRVSQPTPVKTSDLHICFESTFKGLFEIRSSNVFTISLLCSKGKKKKKCTLNFIFHHLHRIHRYYLFHAYLCYLSHSVLVLLCIKKKSLEGAQYTNMQENFLNFKFHEIANEECKTTVSKGSYLLCSTTQIIYEIEVIH